MTERGWKGRKRKEEKVGHEWSGQPVRKAGEKEEREERKRVQAGRYSFIGAHGKREREREK